ncbi:MAG: ATP synthase F1 subunit epsilon [Candidatus Pacebacteria bacterium CG_4_10_14_3_um_filter_34_15]|nr:ATP synthase F1 subunit epsilon [Candidatus Pacearchaeota archaeon]NCQ65559.1 ATP synthase F1 subunit epsilon [Candidatus Paceibacterota bacterium]OIO44817.1 MAG: ATP synthase F1 subunit epsilon [Candidatus Pacebacteria bacterium CG1_02_43_31]PIQ81303.1 MAG: ATP synthase F1 subunit epsilon [Candidatus Pacebacteria bacterium CG11_big_fil_rev_8_21_14_0_20_34_55]PIX81130.1 MAG: ATP synthase F1 subunit epsilon [Candidatus Pacebacteria bacterium CG_4_10_14_3_um_filter_34_15]PJC43849.1 MAG: ATP s
MKKILLTVVTQEEQLLQTKIDQITAPTVEGEITILPNHIALFSKLKSGELKYIEENEEHSLVISNGFITVSPESEVTVIVDSATLDRNISVSKAEQAVRDAKEAMTKTTDQRELLLAEASLKRAMLEIRIAQKSKKSRI